MAYIKTFECRNNIETSINKLTFSLNLYKNALKIILDINEKTPLIFFRNIFWVPEMPIFMNFKGKFDLNDIMVAFYTLFSIEILFC